MKWGQVLQSHIFRRAADHSFPFPFHLIQSRCPIDSLGMEE
jgi:hypothetical protein